MTPSEAKTVEILVNYFLPVVVLIVGLWFLGRLKKYSVEDTTDKEIARRVQEHFSFYRRFDF